MHYLRRLFSKIAHSYYERRAKLYPSKGKILMFHNIGSKGGGLYNIPTYEFERFLMRVKDKNIIRLESWKEHDSFYAISIDDVPEEFYHNAFPLLQKYKIPFTLFVSTGLLDTKGYISIEQLKEMAASEFCSIGSHGVTHGEYTLLSKEEKMKELLDSSKELSQLIGKPVNMYAFPYGSLYACGYTQKHLVLDYYKYGFGTVQIPITMPAVLPEYYIPRINVTTNNITNI